MYGKIFEEIFHSSLMFNEGWKAVYIFSAMVVLADENGKVHHDPRSLYRLLGLDDETGVTWDEFLNILDALMSPDENTNLPDHEGRRLIPFTDLDDEPGDRGYWLPTYSHYRKKGSKEDRLTQNRKNKRNQRDREAGSSKNSSMSANVSNGQRSSAMSAHTDTDTDTDKEKNTKKRKGAKRASSVPENFEPTEQGVEYAKERLPNVDVPELRDAFVDYHRSKGTTAKDWDASWRTWCRNAESFGFKKRVAPKGPVSEEKISEARRQAATDNQRRLRELGLAL